MTAGIDAVAWDELTHAYGPAGDVPELIRATASADADIVDEAIYELFGTVVHQGTVYSATPAALPFLVDIAARPETHSREMLLALVGTAAASDDLSHVSREDIHAALAGRTECLLGLLADPDPGVREMAAYILGHVPGVPLARLRWEVEPVARVRASILMAAHLLDPDRAVGWLPTALAETGPVAAAAAALTAVCGLPWSAAATTAVIDAFAGEDPLAGWVWATDWLSELLTATEPAVTTKIVAALARSPEETVRQAACRAGTDALRARRCLPEALIPELAPLLLDPAPAVRSDAVRAVRASGVARLAETELAALAAEPGPADEAHAPDPRDAALCLLIGLGHPRARELVLAAWSGDRRGHDVADALREAGFPADPALVEVVAGRLRALGEDRLEHNERIALVRLLGSWGPAAAAALPELRAALPLAPLVTPAALAAVAPGVPEIRATISAAAQDNPAAARVWHELSGDVDPLLRAIAADLTDAYPIGLLDGLGQAARPLLPRLAELLTGEAAPTHPGRLAQVAAARITWRLTGELPKVLPTMWAVLAGGHRPAAQAADLAAELSHELAAELGTDAVALLLRELSTDRVAAVGAARALWRLTGERATGALLAVVAAGHPAAEEAVTLLVEMDARDTAPRLRALAEQDARIIRSGTEHDIVQRDDRLRSHLRQAVTTLT